MIYKRIITLLFLVFLPLASFAGDKQILIKKIHQIIDKFPGEVGLYAQEIGKPASRIEINAQKYYPMASTYKVPIMLQVYRHRDAKLLSLEETANINHKQLVAFSLINSMSLPKSFTLKDLILLMITVSDNTASDVLMRKVGINSINRTLQRFKLTTIKLSRSVKKLLNDQIQIVGDDQLFKGKKDKLFNNGRDMTTPKDMAKLLELIATNKAASKESCQDMMDVLSSQKINHRIPLLLEDADVAHKTGSFAGVLSDVGVIKVNGKRIVLAIYTVKKRFRQPSHYSDMTIAKLSKLIADYYALS